MPDTRGPYTEPGPFVVGRRPGVVEEMAIARMWRGWVRTEQANAYVAYITGTGLREYAATPGNLGCQMWTRDLGDGCWARPSSAKHDSLSGGGAKLPHGL